MGFYLVAESIWWGLPFIIIVILSVITYRSCHELDPYRPIRTGVKPIKIQVVALQWKWLFIYPEQQIASVNFVQFPIDTPIDFEITSGRSDEFVLDSAIERSSLCNVGDDH